VGGRGSNLPRFVPPPVPHALNSLEHNLFQQLRKSIRGPYTVNKLRTSSTAFEMSPEPSSQPGLLALPNELVITIIEHIPHKDTHSISNFSVTNHRIYTLTLDHLYATISPTTPWLLLRTISGTPELAGRIRKLVWKHDATLTDDKEILWSCVRRLRARGNGVAAVLFLHHEFLEIFVLFTPKVRRLNGQVHCNCQAKSSRVRCSYSSLLLNTRQRDSHHMSRTKKA
jgi:hypothetical protein